MYSPRAAPDNRQDGLLASTSATSLQSLQYDITDIQVCEELQRSGSGYSNPTGCFRVFSNPNIPTTQAFYRDYVVSSALVDLMTAEGQATLRNPATAEPAPAEQTTYMLNNGGAYFAFASPFVVTAADASAGTPIQMDLVFNPANFGSVTSVGDCTQDAFAPICDTTNGLKFSMPFVRMSPVPRKAGEQTRKETYLVDFESGSSASQLRVELYFNAADPEKAVRGVDVALVSGD